MRLCLVGLTPGNLPLVLPASPSPGLDLLSSSLPHGRLLSSPLFPQRSGKGHKSDGCFSDFLPDGSATPEPAAASWKRSLSICLLALPDPSQASVVEGDELCPGFESRPLHLLTVEHEIVNCLRSPVEELCCGFRNEGEGSMAREQQSLNVIFDH